ncbi:MAG TPA: glycosyltransferase [Acidimicrobiales bacterium]|nr:glycosyltransferase [Acidimicrobiales bacterium]
MSLQVHQVLVSASPGDAVTTAALELRPLLSLLGPSNIYARYYAPELAGQVLPIGDYHQRPDRGPADLLVFHVSIGDADVAAFVAERTERLVLVYHNISPSEPFRPFDPAFADLLDAGRAELARLRDRTVLALADSEYNARELEALGFGDVRVSPLVIDVGALQGTEVDPATDHHLNHVVEGPVFAYVGQLLPHKRPDLLLEAFYVLTTFLLPGANLVLVGPTRLRRYHHALQHFVRELGLAPSTWLTGYVTTAQLAAFYRRADVFVTASEHEGFCVPLVESMAFGVPVIGRDHAAIPETLGGAGLLLPRDEDPVLMAEAMAAVATDGNLRGDLIERGRRRLERFDSERASARMLGHVLSVA